MSKHIKLSKGRLTFATCFNQKQNKEQNIFERSHADGMSVPGLPLCGRIKLALSAFASN